MAFASIALIGIGVGLVMGLTGAGGGILAVPALIYAMGWSMQETTPVALLAVTMGAAFGAIDGLRQKQVRYRAALLMAVVGMPLTSVGVQLAHQLPQVWLLAAFAALLLLVAYRLLKKKTVAPGTNQAQQSEEAIEHAKALAHIDPATGRFDWTPRAIASIASIGAIAGFTAGLLGVGGGFVIVPMLRRFTNASMHIAVATSLLVIALVGAAGFGSSLAHGATIPWMLAIWFVVATVIGMAFGRRVTRLLSAQMVQFYFALLLLLVATYLLVKVFNMLA
jgi:hypothetical protein